MCAGKAESENRIRAVSIQLNQKVTARGFAIKLISFQNDRFQHTTLCKIIVLLRIEQILMPADATDVHHAVSTTRT